MYVSSILKTYTLKLAFGFNLDLSKFILSITMINYM
jgi:hypothetical protein